MKTNKTNLSVIALSITFIVFNIYKSSAATRTWDNGGGDNLWSTDANWSDNTEPGSGDIALFNATSITNCNIDANINIAGIDVQSGYTGTITQGDFPINVGTSDAIFDFGTGGAFSGDNDKEIVVADEFKLLGGTFTSTRGVLEIKGNYTKESDATFSHNNGRVEFSTNSLNITGNTTFNDLKFSGTSSHVFTISTSPATTLTVGGTLTGTGSGSFVLNGNVIDALGNVTFANSRAQGGSALIRLSGQGSIKQTLTGSQQDIDMHYGIMPNVEIAACATCTVTLVDTVSIGKDFTYTSGVLDPGTSKLGFHASSTSTVTVSGTMTLHRLEFYGYQYYVNFNIGNTITVTNNLTLATTTGGALALSTGTINLKGDILFRNAWGIFSESNSATININGTSPQAMTAPWGGQSASGTDKEGYGALPKMVITNTVNIASNSTVSVFNDFTIGSGGKVVAGSGSTLAFMKTLTVRGDMSLYNLSFVTQGSTVTVGATGSTTVITTNSSGKVRVKGASGGYGTNVNVHSTGSIN